MERTDPSRSAHTPGVGRGQASAARSRFTRIERLAITDSTNTVAGDAAAAGTADGYVVVADEQRAGRGRRLRRWVSPPGGSLLCSVVLRPPIGIEHAYLASAVVALGALRAVRRYARAPVSIKWPNDLISGPRKLAGVLAEVVAPDPLVLVVGIGLNLAWPEGWPTSTGDPEVAELVGQATTLSELSGEVVGRDEFLEAFLDELDLAYGLLFASDGPSRTLSAYRKECSTIGEVVLVETEHGSTVGMAIDVSDTGRLVLDAAGTQLSFEVADVVHLRGE